MFLFEISLVFLLFQAIESTNSLGTEEDASITSFPPLTKAPVVANKVNVYQSSEDGLRFAFSQIDFNEPQADDFAGGLRATLTLDLNKTRQKIDGFGGAFTDAACGNLMKLPENLRQQIVDDYFHPENGLEYVLGRTPIGGSDFSTRVYTLDDIENNYDLSNFSLAFEDTEYKIPIIKMAMKHVPEIKIISAVWSPPTWLKTNKKINHRGSIVGPVTGQSFQTFANYFVKYLDAYKKEGIKIFGISPVNEPNNGRLIPFFPFNCVGFSPSQMRDFIVQTLGPTLKKAGYGKDNLKLFIVDDQRIYLNRWVDTIMSAPNASDYVTHVAFHWYFNSISSAKNLDTIKERHPNLEGIWSTEACSGSYSLIHKHVELGSWARAQEYAKDITEDLNHQTNAWIDWNLALDSKGGPNWSKNFVDAPIIIDFKAQQGITFSTAPKYIRQPMYYALAHFTKFIKPNSLNLEQNLKISGKLTWFSTLYATAFKTPDNNIVVVATNTYSSPLKLSIAVPDNKNQVINYVVPKKSITTFVWKI